MQLRPARRAVRQEADERAADLHLAAVSLDLEQVGQRHRFLLRILGEQLQLGQAQLEAEAVELLP